MDVQNNSFFEGELTFSCHRFLNRGQAGSELAHVKPTKEKLILQNIFQSEKSSRSFAKQAARNTKRTLMYWRIQLNRQQPARNFSKLSADLVREDPLIDLGILVLVNEFRQEALDARRGVKIFRNSTG